jgi:3-deoxy-D-manno-octulosonic-acid transferase
VLEAHRRVQGAGAVLVLAPRHPARFNEVAELLQRSGVPYERRSRATAAEAAPAAEPASTFEVLLVDTLGELLEFYAAADVAFVGGSLVPIGGHNLLEPAAAGVPILTGPHNSNSEDVARLLIASGAAAVVHNPSELAHKVAALLADPQARARIGELGRATVHNNRGALHKLLGLIEPLLRG